MLTGATTLLKHVPCTQLHPLVVVKSQVVGFVGFILILHNVPWRQGDLLFLQGSKIVEIIRMTIDHRYPVDLDMVKLALMERQFNSVMYLYSCPQDAIDCFLKTLHAGRCLTLRLSGYTRPLVPNLLRDAGCRRGLLELNQFENTPPRLLLWDYQGKNPLKWLRWGHVALYNLENADEPHHIRRRTAAPEKPEGTAGMSVEPDVAPPLDLPGAHAQEDEKLAALFRVLFQSFRLRANECYGRNCDEEVTNAMKEVQSVVPEFDVERIIPKTLPLLFDVIMKVTCGAPLLKRTRLRDATKSLTAELYNEYYNILKEHDVVPQIERFYAQFRK